MGEHDWQKRFAAARDVLPTQPWGDLGLLPHAHTTLELSTALRNAEVAASLLPAESPGWHMAQAVVVLLREQINARVYAENMRAKSRSQPDRIEALIDRVQELLSRG